MSYSIEPVPGPLGARVKGLNMAKPVSDQTMQALLEVWYDRQVLIFEDQSLSNQQHIDFSRRIGPLEVHPSGKYV